jgi:hypothetical protein
MTSEQSDGEGVQITIRLPSDAVEMIESGLISFGLYGKKRATICTNLILDMLKTQAVQEQIRIGRAKAST